MSSILNRIVLSVNAPWCLLPPLWLHLWIRIRSRIRSCIRSCIRIRTQIRIRLTTDSHKVHKFTRVYHFLSLKTMYTWSILIPEKVLQALLPTHPRYFIDLNISLHISFGIEINKTYFMLGPISMFSLHDSFTDSSRHPWQQVWWHLHEQSQPLLSTSLESHQWQSTMVKLRQLLFEFMTGWEF